MTNDEQIKAKNELIEAAKMLKEYCDKCECDDCLFYTNCNCVLDSGSPNCWKLPKPSRWTDADIALAKALKAFGVNGVYLTTMSYPQRRWRVKDIQYGILPDGAFMALEEQEFVSLDDIIKGSENR